MANVKITELPQTSAMQTRATDICIIDNGTTTNSIALPNLLGKTAKLAWKFNDGITVTLSGVTYESGHIFTDTHSIVTTIGNFIHATFRSTAYMTLTNTTSSTITLIIYPYIYSTSINNLVPILWVEPQVLGFDTAGYRGDEGGNYITEYAVITNHYNEIRPQYHNNGQWNVITIAPEQSIQYRPLASWFGHCNYSSSYNLNV